MHMITNAKRSTDEKVATRLLSSLFGYNLKEVVSVVERRRYITIAIKISFPVSILFAALNLFVFGFIQLAIAEAVVACLLLPAALFISKHDSLVSIAECLILIYGILITAALAHFGGLEGSGILWVFTFPFLAFMLKGQRLGWIYCIAWIIVICAMLLAAPMSPYSHSYSANYSVQVILALIFYSIVAAAFNLARSRFEEKLHTRVVANTARAKEYLEKLQFLSLHDQLTGLPNRLNIMNILGSELPGVDPQTQSMVVVNLHLERMFEISNILGEQGSDYLIRSISKTLTDMLEGRGHLARTRRDEFVYIFKMDKAGATFDQIMDSIGAFQFTYQVDGYPIHIEHTMGISVYPSHASDPDALLNKAEQAMLQAKAARTEVSIYDGQLNQMFIKRHLLFGKLRQALSNNELILYFQPQIDLQTGRITGAEALVRWKDSSGSFVSPAEFIQVAENSGLIKPLTGWVIRESFRNLVKWRELALGIDVSINLSARNLVDAELITDLQDLLAEYSIPADCVVLEITESSFVEFPGLVMKTIDRLHQIGFKQSIDDFGTGYSSLSYLQNLKVDELKIDQSFVRCLQTDPGSRAIVKSTIQLAHNFGIKVVAEGIETDEAARYLMDVGCDTGQGYIYSKPLPADQFVDFARDFIPRQVPAAAADTGITAARSAV